MRFAPGLAVMSGLLALTLTAAAAKPPATADIAKASFLARQGALGYSESQINAFLAKASYNPAVLDAISRPFESQPWFEYRQRFLTPERLNAGLAFWRRHADVIARASATFGVEPQIIVAIIGIETHYGKTQGKYLVRDALYTLGFHYPQRAGFFLKELGELQQLEKEQQLNLDTLYGSYAGAMGLCQFMPSSYRYYAVDFDGDGKRDLLGSTDDAIASIANYFHQHGWQANAPVVRQLDYHGSGTPTKPMWQGEPLSSSAGDILGEEFGLADERDLDISQPALLLQLDGEKSSQYWLGLKNFFVITRYNRSPLYAMAAFEFSEQLKYAHAKR
ncbi:lytic murein transglycosylase B [Shewanella sp. JM162201]|uniref:Lytic murein transglycosylase B n=1 Tax=Shewanella jiangmenensis TaxID=2837387 RepID=A0ABS5V2E2_9GAMM|nr:lytic murein transglycosylase B [Shewanella jiangmenensis]MBT1444629.1 lytic murein transglycosylase B [Shewanella jiangmenensis]